MQSLLPGFFAAANDTLRPSGIFDWYREDSGKQAGSLLRR